MRVIVTHKSRSLDEIMDLISKTGNFTAPIGLPHYRYAETKKNVGILKKLGLLQLNKVNDIHHNFVRGKNYQFWEDSGRPKVALILKNLKSKS